MEDLAPKQAYYLISTVAACTISLQVGFLFSQNKSRLYDHQDSGTIR
jgi:hypothetical protein